MSSDQQNINEVQYSDDDSDYQHHDSVLSTGHRNSLAHRQSVSNRQSIGNRQSKRMSYGRKHNESKIEEILNKVEQEEQVVIHQTESHIVGELVADNHQEPKPEVNEQQTVVSSDIITNNSIPQQTDLTMNYSQMLVSVNDSQNQSDVFEVMEMSQVSQQQPQSNIYIQQESSNVQVSEQPKNKQVKDEDLDYLPNEPYVETHQHQNNQQTMNNELAIENDPQQQINPQQQQPSPSQQHQAIQHHRQPQTLASQIIHHQPQSHSLGDQFNTNQQQAEEQILNSFRDSTEEKRRNRVPGNSEIEYADQNDYYANEDGVNVAGYERKNSEEEDTKQQVEAKIEDQQSGKQLKELKQQPIDQNQVTELDHQRHQLDQNLQKHAQQQPVAQPQPSLQIPSHTHEQQNQQPQQIHHVQQYPQQTHQAQAPVNEEHEVIITSQDVDLPEQTQHHKKLAEQENLQAPIEIIEHVDSEEKHGHPHNQQVQPSIQQQIHAIEQEEQLKIEKPIEAGVQQPRKIQQSQHTHSQLIKPTVHEQLPSAPQAQQSQQWPSSYGQPQQQQLQQPQQPQQPQLSYNQQQNRHQQVESIVSQPNHQQQSSSQSQDQPGDNTLDQRIPLPQSDDQVNNTTSNILPPSSNISTNSQQNQGIISYITQRQSQTLDQLQQSQPQQTTQFQQISSLEIDFAKTTPSNIVKSQIRQSLGSKGEVVDLYSDKDPSQIIEEESHHGIETVPEEEEQSSSEPNGNDGHPEEQFVEQPQNQSQSQFIKIQQDNSSFSHSQSNARYIQSDIPPPIAHNEQPTQSSQKPTYNHLHEVPPVVMTRFQSSQDLPQTPVKQLNESKKDIQASQYFVVDKNLSSLDIYGKSQYNQHILPQLTSQPSRDTIVPHPLKNQLMKQAQQKRQASMIEQSQQQPHASARVPVRVSVPKQVEPQMQAPRFEEPQQILRNSVSNADLVVSTSELQTAKKKKEKAGSNQKAPIENPESCKCVTF